MSRLIQCAISIAILVSLTGCKHVYFASQLPNHAWGVFRIPAGGGRPDLVIGESHVRDAGIAIDDKSKWLFAALGPGTGAGIYRMTLAGDDLKLICPSKAPGPIAIDNDNHRLFWIDPDEGSIRRCNFDGTENIAVVTGLESPSAVAFDEDHQTLYWSQQNSRRGIWRSSADGANPALVIALDSLPNAIAVDGEAGRIFWSQPFPVDKIMTADLSAPVPRDFSDANKIFVEHMVVDDDAKLVYWTERPSNSAPPTRIMRMAYDRSHRQIVHEFGDAAHYAAGLALGK